MTGELESNETAFPKGVLRVMSGANELAVAEAAARPGNRPEKVSWVLNAVFEAIAGQPVTLDVVRRLPSGTREWLLQQAALHFRPDLTWFEANCIHCSHPYDLSLNLADSTRYQPVNGRLQIEVKTSLGIRSFLIPNGAHEEACARAGLLVDPRRFFAGLCGLSAHAKEEAIRLTEHDLLLIDEAIEAASPDISDETSTACPSCGKQTSARIDPLLFAFPHEGTILQETHLLAMAYGWTHDQILSLNVSHRSFYATMIVQDYRHTQRPGAGRPI